jgi:hypothetical protein
LQFVRKSINQYAELADFVVFLTFGGDRLERFPMKKLINGFADSINEIDLVLLHCSHTPRFLPVT